MRWHAADLARSAGACFSIKGGVMKATYEREPMLRPELDPLAYDGGADCGNKKV